jgi:hypothetical protein
MRKILATVLLACCMGSAAVAQTNVVELIADAVTGVVQARTPTLTFTNGVDMTGTLSVNGTNVNSLFNPVIGGYVASVNGQTGNVVAVTNVTAGANITVGITNGNVTVSSASGGSGLTTVSTNLIYVDASTGSDSTGTRGNAALPFLTPNAALAAVLTTNDLVYVRAGRYALTNSLNVGSGVTRQFYFEPGAVVTTTNLATYNIFNFPAGTGNLRVYGSGSFDTRGSSSRVVGDTAGTSTLVFEFDSALSGTRTFGMAGAADVLIRGRFAASTNEGLASLVGSVIDLRSSIKGMVDIDTMGFANVSPVNGLISVGFSQKGIIRVREMLSAGPLVTVTGNNVDTLIEFDSAVGGTRTNHQTTALFNANVSSVPTINQRLVIRGKTVLNSNAVNVADLRPWSQGEAHILDVDYIDHRRASPVFAAYPEFGAANGVKTNWVVLKSRVIQSAGGLLSGGTEGNMGEVWCEFGRAEVAGSFATVYSDSTSPGFGQRYIFVNSTLVQHSTNTSTGFVTGYTTGLVAADYVARQLLELRNSRVILTGTNLPFRFEGAAGSATNRCKVSLIGSTIITSNTVASGSSATHSNTVYSVGSASTTDFGLGVVTNGALIIAPWLNQLR